MGWDRGVSSEKNDGGGMGRDEGTDQGAEWALGQEVMAAEWAAVKVAVQDESDSQHCPGGGLYLSRCRSCLWLQVDHSRAPPAGIAPSDAIT